MTNLLVRPPRAEQSSAPSQAEPSDRTRTAALHGAMAAAWTAALGLLGLMALSVVGWFGASTGTFPDAMRVGALAWVVSNGGGLQLTSASVTLVPLGALGVNGWLLHQSGRWVGSSLATARWRECAVGVSALAATYTAIGVVTAVATSSPAATAGVARPFVAFLLCGTVLGGSGVLAGAGRLRELFAALPEEVRAAMTGGAAGLLALFGASAVVLASSLLAHFSTAVTLAEQLHAGLVGGVLATVVMVAFVPNAVLCAGAFATGAGFSVGSGAVIQPGSPATGDLPGLPLLAAVPRASTSLWLEAALLLLPVFAGALAGAVAVRRFPVTGLQGAAVRGGLAGLAAGGAFGVLAVLSAGGIGPGRMESVGPRPGVVLTSGLLCLVGGAVAAAVHRLWEVKRG